MNDDIFGEIIGHLPVSGIKHVGLINKHYYDYCQQLIKLYPKTDRMYPLDDTFNEWKNNYNTLLHASIKAVELCHIIEAEKTIVYLIIDDDYTENFHLLPVYDEYDKGSLNFIKSIVNCEFKFKVNVYYEHSIGCYFLSYTYGDMKHTIYKDNIYDVMYRYCYFYSSYHAVDDNNMPFDLNMLLELLEKTDDYQSPHRQNIIHKRISRIVH